MDKSSRIDPIKRDKRSAYQSAVPDGIPSLDRDSYGVGAEHPGKIPASLRSKDRIAKAALCLEFVFAERI